MWVLCQRVASPGNGLPQYVRNRGALQKIRRGSVGTGSGGLRSKTRRADGCVAVADPRTLSAIELGVRTAAPDESFLRKRAAMENVRVIKGK